MTRPVTVFIQNLIAVYDAIEALINASEDKAQTNLTAYSHAKFELLKSADAVAEDWMSGSLSSVNATVLMQSGLRTYIGPLSSQYTDVQGVYEQFKSQLPDVTQAEIVRSLLLKTGPSAIILEGIEIAEKLSVLNSSAAATALLEQEVPDTLGDLRSRFSVKSVVQAKLHGLSKGP